MKALCLSVIIFLSICNLYSQEALQYHLNGYRPGDKIIKQQMTGIFPGASGRNFIWDFTQADIMDDYYPLIYFRINKGDTIHLGSWEHRTRYLFEQQEQSIWMTGYKNTSAEMAFELPELQMHFPLSYGDTLSAPFHGSGLYYQSTEMTASGRTYIHADATGTLITPGNDTLRNVLRVKRTREYDNIGIEGATMRLETYNWYAPGYRYPIFEVIRSFSMLEGEESEDFSTAFYFPIIAIESLAEDTANEAIREQAQQDRGILLYCQTHPNPVETDCHISFELSTQASVSIRLCNILGLPISSIRQEILPAGLHERSISMNGLQQGNYLLYIQADNYVKKQVVIKK
ncbi:MAG: T9SS type A sorting domain-containing protein [Dysgonamonadaceae bacterium]|jgi:hypothetical protein|nr:T9SS type A sorting domain-containing protein [Dysgonamonadaceae bacterium]